MKLSTEYRLVGVSALADLTRCCASKEDRLMRAKGILGASLEKVTLQQGSER